MFLLWASVPKCGSLLLLSLPEPALCLQTIYLVSPNASFPRAESSSTRGFAWHDTRSLSSQVNPSTWLCCKLHKGFGKARFQVCEPLTFDSVMEMKWYITLVLLFPKIKRRSSSQGFQKPCELALQGTRMPPPCPPRYLDVGGAGWGRASFSTHVCLQSLNRLRLFVIPLTVACQIPLSLKISKQEYGGGLPFPPPRDLSHPGIKPMPPASLALAGRAPYHWATSEATSATTTAKSLQSLQSCPTLCDPIDGSPPGSAVPGILQARTLEWVAISFSNAWKWKVKVKSLSRV